ncbi:hypothetical protein BPNPMPFG_005459 [Mesorhizobium sp. AR07]|uniref:hypothetical protein n=1 Tax=Mesorhizobium sp. AR07 TaxID=2865838 RepID=UPI00215FFD62|nr:hypothetical protein [Mesorhizobium sp. AR07]UVK43645.1 hypothetical protein BPNPMPFG_005459 [Mesorhizobium sp. AR07]
MNWITEYQGLLGALVALLAALLGFGGVIYSQRALAKMSADERTHYEALAKAEAEDRHRQNLASLMNAIVGELQALAVAVADASRLLAAQIQIAEALANEGRDRKTQPRISFQFQTPIFNAYVGSIGLMEPEVAFKVAKLYGHLLSFGTHGAAETPEMEASLAVRVMHSVEASLSSMQREMTELQQVLKPSVAQQDQSALLASATRLGQVHQT